MLKSAAIEDDDLWIWAQRDSNGNHWKFHPRSPEVRKIMDSAEAMPETWDHSPIVPILAVVMLAITVFLLVLFRQNPGLVAGTVAGCLIVIVIYLTLSSIQGTRLKFE